MGGAHRAAGEGQGPLAERTAAGLGTALTAGALCTGPDPVARRIAREVLDAPATPFADMAVLLDPERLVVGGGMMAAEAVVLPALAARPARGMPFPPAVRAARFTADASSRGALAPALDQVAAARRINTDW